MAIEEVNYGWLKGKMPQNTRDLDLIKLAEIVASFLEERYGQIRHKIYQPGLHEFFVYKLDKYRLVGGLVDDKWYGTTYKDGYKIHAADPQFFEKIIKDCDMVVYNDTGFEVFPKVHPIQ